MSEARKQANDQGAVSSAGPLSEPPSRYRRMTLIGAAILATAAALALALYARQLVPDVPPLLLAELTSFEFHPYWVGLFVQIIVFPVALIYLFSNTRLFLRVISKQITSRDTLKLWAVLAAIQLLSQVYDLWLTRLIGEPPLLNLLVVVVGGYWVVGRWGWGWVSPPCSSVARNTFSSTWYLSLS